ncbi:hypothetical protein [Glycomyces sp. NPDC047010]|uniref:hypothetical protein n=1 Tax=Glycomyces sp. NPDC047010 TaxID=3155023 RepID=UPI0033D3F908
MITVRVNRRRFRRIFIAGLVIWVLGIVSSILLPESVERDLTALTIYLPSMVLAAGFGPLVGAQDLVYDPQTRSVFRGSGSGFPRRKFERLEYSIYSGRLYQVRADGRRRVIAAWWGFVPEDWRQFADRLLQDQSVPEGQDSE